MGEQVDRLFDTVNRSSDAFLEAIRFGNDRACRFSKMVIEEAARTQREQADLTKEWMESPIDAGGLTKSAVKTWTQRQRRRLGLSRTFVDEIAGETREAVQRAAVANGDGIDAAVEEPSAAVVRAPNGRRRNGRK